MSKRNRDRDGVQPPAATAPGPNAEVVANADGASELDKSPAAPQPPAATTSAVPPAPNGLVEVNVIASMLHGGMPYGAGDKVKLTPFEALRRKNRGEVAYD